ncbi:hypothetical protein [Novosphingobium taihuense]|uniref:Uncharacterized protein n=1 Tax=Novosphingobium taihuense TaxID=260085 RepID=A0A7W7AAH4_9SPHN|nr:hypothetical protein [Novosphingobium taihuense]MBB4613423.1 hypothetical protein [Novosphingobium taihuense]TWH80929.1 hypothetical protein IQ25_03665 [Novosphingobium taihuense]
MRNALVASSILAAATMSANVAAAQEAPPANAAEDPGVWRASVGVNYSEGDYGDTQSTKVVSAPVALKYRKGGFSIRVSVPWVHIDGPGSILDTPQGRDAGFGDLGTTGDDGGSSGGSDDSSSSGSGSSGSNSGSDSSGSGGSGSGGSGSSGGDDDSGSGGVIVPPSPGTALSNSRGGLGDVSVALGYSLELGRSTWFDLGTRLKLPTASRSKRLGTGKADVTVSGDLVQDIGRFSLFAGARYRFLGKPAGSTLRDTWGAGGGVSYRLPGGTIVGADYDWQESATPGRIASSEATGWVNFGLTRKLRLQVFGSTGFNARSTDFAGGLSLSWRLN